MNWIEIQFCLDCGHEVRSANYAPYEWCECEEE